MPAANCKSILEQANAAIARGDHEGFLRHCTEDTEWVFLGKQTLKGKEAVRRWMATAYQAPPRFDARAKSSAMNTPRKTPSGPYTVQACTDGCQTGAPRKASKRRPNRRSAT